MEKKDDIIYQKNLLNIQKYCPMYYDKIQDVYVEPDKYILESTKEQLNTLKIVKEQKSIYFHSKYYPMREASEWVDNNYSEQSEIHIFFGFANGYHIMSLLKKVPKDNKIIILEPDIKIFKMAIQNTDLESIFINKNVIICLEDVNIFKDSLDSNIGYNVITKINKYILPSYSILYYPELESFYKVVNDIIISKVISMNTSRYFAEMWQENLLKNLVYLFESTLTKDFKNRFHNMPLILVAAGPSLTKNVSMLKEVKGRAVIVCVGRALKVLLDEGIKPDIVAALDGEDVCYLQFKGIDYSDIALLYSARVYPQILDDHKGEKILFPNYEMFINLIFQRMGIDYFDISCGSSVATMAFSFACYTGANPIVFVGQDLAYKGSETHAKGTYYGDNNDVDVNKKFFKKVIGINGEELDTGYDLYTFLRWFEDAISLMDKDRVFINATEGGANIQGTLIKTLSQVIREYCIDDKIAKPILDDIYKNKQKYDDLLITEYITDLEKLSNNLDEIISLCKKALRYNDQLYKIYNLNLRKDVTPIIKKLDQIDETLKSKKDEFALLDNILRPIYDQIISQKKPVKESTEKERGLHAVNMGKVFYEKVGNKIEDTKPLLIELVKKLKIKYPATDGGN